MAKNEFLPFGIGAGANVLTPADWSALPARSKGFASGAAKSKELNTVWRQSSVISNVVAQFIADSSSKDVLDNGDTATLLAALKNLLTPTGVPLPWPTATAPTGWLKCNGATFSKTLYPNLALAYPSGVLPDLRGEFIRGWDDGRGVDTGRALLNLQGDAIRNIYGGFDTYADFTATGVFIKGNLSTRMQALQEITNVYHSVFFDASRVVPTASENRPRNVAFNYIVRAA
ncbi:tail fiber protein [Serratia sp. D1N4]